MTYADTDGLLDRCHCGAVAGLEHVGACSVRARCTECCEQTELDREVYPVVNEWNLARRAEKQAIEPFCVTADKTEAR